jgi:hypothetical protein
MAEECVNLNELYLKLSELGEEIMKYGESPKG